jgi:hypothetical protein
MLTSSSARAPHGVDSWWTFGCLVVMSKLGTKPDLEYWTKTN